MTAWTRTGTPYFVSLKTAIDYHRTYGATIAAVKRKIEAGEIHIGKPPLNPGDRLVTIDKATRYAIETPEGRKA